MKTPVEITKHIKFPFSFDEQQAPLSQDVKNRIIEELEQSKIGHYQKLIDQLKSK